MEFKRFLCYFFVIMAFVTTTCHGYQFYVGGKDGWVVKPSENYNHWAERNRFQVNDTLLFKFKNGSSDSVLVVTKDDYYSCNTTKPIQSLSSSNGGDSSIYKFVRSGFHFFISGNSDNCNKGQKLIIVVLAVRHKTHQPPPSPSPSPVASSPSPVVSPSPSPTSPSPVASSPSPVVSPSPSPVASSPSPVVSPSPSPVASSPSPVVSPSPASSPSQVVAPPVESPKAGSDTPPAPFTPVQAPPASDQSPPSDNIAPEVSPSRSGSLGLACSKGLVFGFWVGLSVILGSF